LAGAKWICQNMGVMKLIFMKLLPVLKVLKTIGKIAESKTKLRIKILRIHLSKVAATTKAVKEQYPNRTLVAFRIAYVQQFEC
jgi:UDP-N-acetylmuramate: L-alanyl-gamma-D-glutamyl-meso-diaminopimelate ligase